MATTPSKVIQKSFPFEASILNDSLGEFSGYASVWSVDDKGERMAPGAFSKSLARAEAKRVAGDRTFLFAVTWYHFSDQPLGGIYETREDSHGLFVRGLIDLTTKVGKRAFSGLKKGYIDGLSIQGFVNKDCYKGAVRQIDECELVAIGVGLFPVNRDARVTSVKSARDAWLEAMINDMASVASRHGAKEKEQEKMGRIPYDDDNYVRPLHGATGNESDLQRAWREQAGEPQGYRIERGLEEESPAAFQRAWRAELREESDLWLLSDKNRIAELEKREKERQAKQQKQHEALLAERREQAERQAAWNRDVFSPEDFSNLTGIDLHWCRVIFKQYIASGLVAPIDEAALTLSRSDVQLIARRSAEDIEFQVLKARNKRAQGGR